MHRRFPNGNPHPTVAGCESFSNLDLSELFPERGLVQYSFLQGPSSSPGCCTRRSHEAYRRRDSSSSPRPPPQNEDTRKACLCRRVGTTPSATVRRQRTHVFTGTGGSSPRATAVSAGLTKAEEEFSKHPGLPPGSPAAPRLTWPLTLEPGRGAHASTELVLCVSPPLARPRA